jgi:hypothetical protein
MRKGEIKALCTAEEMGIVGYGFSLGMDLSWTERMTSTTNAPL